MFVSNKIKRDISEKKKQKEYNIEYFKEQILITDALKEEYDSAVMAIDRSLQKEIEAVNSTIYDVQTAYQDRIDSGCRTDLYWRVVGFDTSTSEYSLVVDKLSVVGYGTSVAFLDASGGITTYSEGEIEIPGVQGDNLHAIKYYDEPYLKDIGDTTIGSFIGIVGTASTILSIVSQTSDELIESFSVGNLVLCSKNGVFSGDNNKIVGFGTTTISGISTTVMNDVVGIATTTLDVSTILLESATIGFSSLPESDGSYVDFTIVTDPATFESTKSTRFRYEVKFTKNPFSPQTIGVMTLDNVGLGTFVEYDNSSKPPATQSWKPELEGTEKGGEKVKEPNVGAGRIYNFVGFTSEPTYFGTPQPEGTTITTAIITGLYTPISPPAGCSAIETNLTNAITERDTAESNLVSGLNSIQSRVNAANALRDERSQYSLKIWGLRQSIGGEGESIDNYESLENYIGEIDS